MQTLQGRRETVSGRRADLASKPRRRSQRICLHQCGRWRVLGATRPFLSPISETGCSALTPVSCTGTVVQATPQCFLQSEGRYSLSVEMNMMTNPTNMGMWYPILERETRGTVSGRIPRPAGELVSLRAGERRTWDVPVSAAQGRTRCLGAPG